MSRSEDAERVGLRPSEFRVQLFTFMPFVAFTPFTTVADISQRLNSQVADGQSTNSPIPNVWTPVGDGHGPSPGAGEDLRFWDYSDSLIEELTSQLPHRQWWQEISVEDAPHPRSVNGGEWLSDVCTAQIWNTGIGHLTTAYTLSSSGSTSWNDVRDSVVGIDTKRELLIQGDATVAIALASTFDDGPLPPPALAKPGVRESGVQWVQHLFVLESPTVITPELLDIVAVAVSDGGAHLRCAADTGHAEVRLGIEACIATNPHVTDLRDALIRVIATQTSVWAAAIELDRVLLRQLSHVTVRGHTLPLSDLEKRAIASLQLFERVQRFRASVSTISVHLATIDKDVWGRVNEEWRLGDQLDSLETKLNALEHVQRNLIDTLSTRQGRILNQVVLLITLLTFSSFLLTSWDFSHKRFDPFSWEGLVVASVSAVWVLVLFGYVRRRLGRITVGFARSNRLWRRRSRS